MLRNALIPAAVVALLALPFLFRREEAAADWRPGDPELVVVTPHNEAIRQEFGRAFSAWHAAKYGRPVRVDWRALGGATEIGRYLTASYVAAARAWWTGAGHPWSPALGEAMVDRAFDAARPPETPRRAGEDDAAFARRAAAARAQWMAQAELHRAFRATDDPRAFHVGADVFLGGGEYDHTRARLEGLTVPPWPGGPPAGIFADAEGRELIPERLGGEIWRADTFFATASSTFGICYNLDRLRDLGLARPPAAWADLADPAYFRQLGLADPTKSGSIARAFELIVHQEIGRAVEAAGFSEADVARHEDAFARAGLPPGECPPDVPAAYQAAVEQGFLNGLRLLRRLGANARYFADAGSKVPVDVGLGQAAAGLAIDFYGRFQAEFSRDPSGRERMGFVTPRGGSTASGDPVSLLRGAPHRAVAVRFLEFLLGEDGQRIWCYRPGEPGGPVRYALRRIPVRRDFFPSDDPAFAAAAARHRAHAADDLADPSINPYELARAAPYHRRWTGAHYNILRDLVRAMCLDSGLELQAAWAAIIDAGGPARCPEAMALFEALPAEPEPLTWGSAPGVPARRARLDYLRDWTAFFRGQYAKAREAAARERPTDAPQT